MSCASIQRTESSFFTANSIVRWRLQLAKVERAFGISLANWSGIFRPKCPRSSEAAGRPPLCACRIGLFRWRGGRLLGEPRSVAGNRRNKFRNCRVGIQAIDVEGAPELGAALGGLGVRVVKRSPNLTVTLVSDYLEGRLAELNREHLSDGSPWVLVQPSGIFPWSGRCFARARALAGRVSPIA